ncbi:MAG: discoidin domain-containing protein [Leptospirales bacterium]|nr:discoidin domain-containing protein [Leptospirales bacterium]
MEFINISQKIFHKGIIHSSSSRESNLLNAESMLNDRGHWCTKKSSIPTKEFAIIDFEQDVPVDYIKITASQEGASTFPNSFRLEVSNDCKSWRAFYSENNTSLKANIHEIDIPLMIFRFLKILITEPAVLGSSYYSEIGKIEAGIYGIEQVTASSYLGLNTPEKLFDKNPDSYWESAQNNQSKIETLNIDLGKNSCINRIQLTSASEGFPESFHIETSIDNEIWITLINEKNFDAEPNNTYAWETDIKNIRYLRFETHGKQLKNGKYGIKLSEISISAAPTDHLHTHTIGDISPHASVYHAGLIKLSRDGESASGTVVQATDSRLRDASTVFKGIVKLANSFETDPGLAVQANDLRLQPATEQKAGIVRLAYNRETDSDAVVQASDARLQHATEESFGIVKICHDGEYKENSVISGNDSRLYKATTSSLGICKLAEDGATEIGTVVQASDSRLSDASVYNKGIVMIASDGEISENTVVMSSDRRLKDATISNKGIVELAENGEDKEGVAVQGNDKRLKDATISNKGIVELAENGEEKEGVAVQGNDKRLKDATTQSKGIVELAEDGENKEGVAVQGNDKRLKDASEKDRGIVRFAPNGESGHNLAVQADDIRLHDKREPLNHEHNYAPMTHEYASHAGTIAIKGEKSEPFYEITPPFDESSVIYGNNTSKENFSIGVTGISGVVSDKKINAYGVLGHSSHVGVRGQSSGQEGSGAGIIGASRFGAGGIFLSEHEYSIIADGTGSIIGKFDDNLKLIGSGKALLVAGTSEFEGTINIKGSGKEKNFPGSAVELFEADEAEYISPGDILVISEQGNSILSKAKKSYSKSAVGVVSGNPFIVINNSGKEEKLYPIVLGGKALCKVDARNNPIKPGDLIVTSDTTGCGMAGNIDSFDKIGTVIGKALHGLEDGVDLIPIFVIHQ